MTHTHRWGVGGWVGTLVSVGMLAWLLYSYDLEELVRSLQSASYIYLWPIPVLVVANFTIRAVRWRCLFLEDRSRPFNSFFRALMVGYLFNNLMPARAGDLVRVYHLSRHEAISKSKILATLFAERTGDLLVLMVLLSLVLVGYPALPLWLKRAGVVVGVATIGAVFVVGLLRFFGEHVLVHMQRFLAPVLQERSSRFEEIGQNFLAGMAGLFKISNGAVFLLLTALLWGMELGAAYLIAAAFSLDIALGNLLFVTLAIAIGTLVPSSPGYIGTFEFFGLSALSMVGLGGGDALSFVVVLHAVTILGAGVLGALCLTRWSGSVVVRPSELRGSLK